MRRQDLCCLSDCSQRIRNGGVEPVSSLAGELDLPIFDYDAILARWADAFSRPAITVRIYERGQLEGGDVVAAFMKTAGCEAAGPAAAVRKNEGPDASAHACMQMSSSHLRTSALRQRMKHFPP